MRGTVGDRGEAGLFAAPNTYRCFLSFCVARVSKSCRGSCTRQSQTPGITDVERRTILEMMAKGNFCSSSTSTIPPGQGDHDVRVTTTGPSTQGIKTVLHTVSDLATAKAVYAALLGVPPQTDESYYVGFEAQHIGPVPGGELLGMTSPVAYWHVQDIEAKLTEVTAGGATVEEPAHDLGGGRLVATVTDPNGNVLGLLQDR